MQFIDLSHAIEDGMPGFRMRDADGNLTEYTAHVRPFLTHAQSRVFYDGKAEFEITELTLQTSVGTYIDSPYHRHARMRNIGQIELDEVILPGVVIDARERSAWEAVDLALGEHDLRGKAVLVHFGWDQHWGAEAYYAYPFISRATIEGLIVAGVRLVGVDALNIDSARDPERPAHTRLLAENIFIVENLRGLTQLDPHNEAFTFFAVPLRVMGAAAMPVRAFAMVG